MFKKFYVLAFMEDVKNKGCSKNTIKAYNSDLNKFTKWHTLYEKEVVDITKNDVKEFSKTLVNYAPTTKKRIITTLKMFFDYMVSEEHMATNPAISLDSPRLSRKKPCMLDDEDIDNIFVAIRNTESNERKIKRDTIMITLMLCVGVRRAEIVNLKIKDVDFKTGRILINGKGAKQRYVFIDDETLLELEHFIKNERNEYKNAHNSDYVFVTQKGGCFTLTNLSHMVRGYFEVAGCYERGKGCHIFRKTCASKSYEGCRDLLAVAEMLGHSDPKTTQIYTSIAEEKVKKACLAVKY